MMLNTAPGRSPDRSCKESLLNGNALLQEPRRHFKPYYKGDIALELNQRFTLKRPTSYGSTISILNFMLVDVVFAWIMCEFVAHHLLVTGLEDLSYILH